MALNRSRLVVAAAIALVVLVAIGVLVGIFGSGGGDGGAGNEPAPREEGTFPLLGTTGEVPDRPALAVKIENTSRGRPQAGLTEADVVFEEMVEGGLTRLLAVYQSQDPRSVGPVRSARTTDIALLAELGRPLFAWAGAAPAFVPLVRAADIVDVGTAAAPQAYERVPDRRAPYNLFAAPDELRAAGREMDPENGSPPALFTYRPEGSPVGAAGAEPAAGFSTVGSPGLSTAIAWEWDPGTGAWLRAQDDRPHVDDKGNQVSVANVVIRFTSYRDTGVRDVVGAVVPEAETVGEGEAWLLSDGQVVRGRWEKASTDAPTLYTDATGAPMGLTPGQTWVELLPPGAGHVVAPSR